MSNVKGESDVSPRSPRPHARTYENFPRGNWEIPATSLSLEMDRSGKARCHNPDMHVAGKSDSLVVPEKQANKAGPQTAAESVEERRLTEENGKQLILVRTQSRDFQSHGLFGVRATTQRDRGDLIPIRCDSSISKVGAPRRKWVQGPRTEPVPVFAVCGSSARTDLCGRRSVMAVPTAVSVRGVSPRSSRSPAEFFCIGQINNHRRATWVSSQTSTTPGRNLRIQSPEND